jgi:hypothetical protein
MSSTLRINGDQIVRHDTVDHAPGEAMRRAQREGVRDLGKNSSLNECLSFTEEEYALLQRIRPDLFDQELEPQVRRQKWVDFAYSSEGRAFRVK